jgi:hypothetical protein
VADTPISSARLKEERRSVLKSKAVPEIPVSNVEKAATGGAASGRVEHIRSGQVTVL